MTSADLAAVGAATVAVSNPTPGGGVSAIGNFTISPNPAPVIGGISPNSIVQGSSGLTLTVGGVSYVNSSVVLWNGSPRPTTFVNSNQLSASISAADLATFGVANVSVSTPGPGGGVTSNVGFAITFPLSPLAQAAADIAYDPVHSVMYLSVPGNASTLPNSVAVLDPVNSTIINSVATGAGTNPDVLALSDDATMLYVGLDGTSGNPSVTPQVPGAVQQFALPAVTAAANYLAGSDPFFGTYYPLDLQVAPAAPHTTAVTLGLKGSSPRALGGLRIFDDATVRTNTLPGFGGSSNLFDSLQWGADATTLFAGNDDDTAFDFYSLAVNASGVTLVHDSPGVIDNFFARIHYDAITNLVYSDGGNIIDPATGSVTASFFGQSTPRPTARMVPDGGGNAAYFLEQGFGVTIQIQKFDLTTHALLATIPLGDSTIVLGNPLRIIRWGTNGLAFVTDSGHVYILNGLP